MPTNLDALIRYKTLDQCFSTGRKYTLEELAQKCSNSLSEKSGIIRSISKRTIQDDIRVMRGDQLAFNAPIKVNNGQYYYSERDQYVFNKRLDDRDELIKILKKLIDIQKEIKSPDLYTIIEKMDEVTNAGILDGLRKDLPNDFFFEIKLRRSSITTNHKVGDMIEIQNTQKYSFYWNEVIEYIEEWGNSI